MKPLICHKCGQRANSVETSFGIRNDHCGLWSWGNKPLADAETHAARIAGHDAFDVLWRSGKMSRGEAYRALARITGWPVEDCHMATMPKERAVMVPSAVSQILSEGAV